MTTLGKVLIAAESRDLTNQIKRGLSALNLEIQSSDWNDLEGELAQAVPDCLVLGVGEEVQPILDLVAGLRAQDDNFPVIIVSRSKRVEDGVDLIKRGAFDYFTTPLDETKFPVSVAHAIRMYGLVRKVFFLENQIGAEEHCEQLLGVSPPMREVFALIRTLAQNQTTVLLQGESGTGKELVARAIHRLSPRRDRRLIDINCGAIPRELLENELFGHERGAYTGADRRYIGCCERANGGTLFLDEVSEMDPALQVKLLRFLQERSFNRVGGTELISVDVRIIAATNRDLAKQMAAGAFREDLFYRLNVVVIQLPRLKERREDIPLLARNFLQKFAQKNERLFLDFSLEALEALANYDWPGNVRELENAIERVVVLHNDTKVKLTHLPPQFQKSGKGAGISLPRLAKSPLAPLGRTEGHVLPLTLVEKYAIEEALKVTEGNVTEAAKRLQIGQATLYRKLKQYGLRA